jgi:hypothetical protein
MGSYWSNRDMTLVSNQPSPNRRKGRLLCGAKTRAGGCCQVRAEPGKARCRFRGGKSTGPKTRSGRARIAEAQRLRWRHYREILIAIGGLAVMGFFDLGQIAWIISAVLLGIGAIIDFSRKSRTS